MVAHQLAPVQARLLLCGLGLGVLGHEVLENLSLLEKEVQPVPGTVLLRGEEGRVRSGSRLEQPLKALLPHALTSPIWFW